MSSVEWSVQGQNFVVRSYVGATKGTYLVNGFSLDVIHNVHCTCTLINANGG